MGRNCRGDRPRPLPRSRQDTARELRPPPKHLETSRLRRRNVRSTLGGCDFLSGVWGRAKPGLEIRVREGGGPNSSHVPRVVKCLPGGPVCATHSDPGRHRPALCTSSPHPTEPPPRARTRTTSSGAGKRVQHLESKPVQGDGAGV